MAKKNTINWIPAGLIGGSSFFLFIMLFPDMLAIPFIAGALGFYAGIKLFSSDQKEISFSMSGITEAELNSVLADSKEKLLTLKELLKKMNNDKSKKIGEEIYGTAEKIVEDFTKDPKDIRIGRQFLFFFLDSTINILRKYIELSSHQSTSKNVNNALLKVETILTKISEAFKIQLSRLLSDDVLDLESEIKVLETMIQSNGFEKTDNKDS